MSGEDEGEEVVEGRSQVEGAHRGEEWSRRDEGWSKRRA